MTGNTNGAARPQLLVFAGPNGSGKSTINKSVREHFSGEYVNADDIARTLTHIPDARERNLQAAEMARQQREQCMAEGRDLAYETVMSTEEKVADLITAHRTGYLVSLYFITTDNPDLNVQRVINRVAQGGHAVLEAQIRQRYARSLNLLACAVEKADNALVIDNSGRRTEFVARKKDDQYEYSVTALAPPYLKACYQSLKEREESLKFLTQGHQSWTFADASHGREYAGKGVITDWHIALITPGGLEIHDRQLLSHVQHSGDHFQLAYAYQHGKRVQ